ncbi:hypothetical protein PQR66_27195 [Paraburkholderia agricolaris]|uniref:Uncharacterized protein n=1 Tax=Paraburkholderia agricolaris TaxID=2152888 RepID=A0ABW8ZX16_9BURK
MSTDPSHIERELPAGLVIFTSDGRAQFGWQNPETGQFFAEADGSCIVNAVGAVAWASDRMH